MRGLRTAGIAVVPPLGLADAAIPLFAGCDTILPDTTVVSNGSVLNTPDTRSCSGITYEAYGEGVDFRALELPATDCYGHTDIA